MGVLQAHLFYDAFYQRLAIIRVVDRKIIGVPNVMCFRSKYSRENRVKGSHPQVAGIFTHHFFYSLAHLFGRLIGERKRHNIKGVNALTLNEVCDAIGEYPGFARSRTCDKHARPLVIDDSLKLRRV